MKRKGHGKRNFRKPVIDIGAGYPMRLNKFIAHSGICSRRKADELIEAGLITVNGKVTKEVGTKVDIGDKVVYQGKEITPEKYLYVLMNKPRGYLTTTNDDRGRDTVMDILKRSGKRSEALKDTRLYPVGRLDKNTSGVLLITNDGELAQALTHPSKKISKLYHVKLDTPLTKQDMVTIAEGIELEEGVAVVDEIAWPNAEDKSEVGLSIHIGWNRVIRRIFESLGYEVIKLDRVLFAGLTKKNLARGRWRFLNDKEVVRLKHLKRQ